MADENPLAAAAPLQMDVDQITMIEINLVSSTFFLIDQNITILMSYISILFIKMKGYFVSKNLITTSNTHKMSLKKFVEDRPFSTHEIKNGPMAAVVRTSPKPTE